MKKMLFIGGDKRMIYAAHKLCGRFNCYTYCLEGAGLPEIKGLIYPPEDSMFDYAVLPLPTSKDGVNICCQTGSADFSVVGTYVRQGGTVFTSKNFPVLDGICRKNGIKLKNYYEREELTVLNAMLTAEGALATAINELPVAIDGLDVLVTGYGRIGKMTAKYFSALGAHVSVSARKDSDLAWIRAEGYRPIDYRDTAAFKEALHGAALIINTVPHPIIDDDMVLAIRSGTVLIELASQQCLSDLSCALKQGVRVVMSGGLPGKLSPVTAGEIIAETIENILREGGDADDCS